MGDRAGGFWEARPWRRFETKRQRRNRKRRICLLGILSAVIWGNVFETMELLPRISSETFWEIAQEEEDALPVFGIRLRLKKGTVEFYRKRPFS